MKEHLDTIPVLEALEKETECAFCALYRKAESDTIGYLLGASYMEEDVRASTDAAGFCREHYRKLYKGQNTLGTALILSTHMAKVEQELAALCTDEKLCGEKKRMFSASSPSEMEQKLSAVEDSCFACTRIQNRMNNYYAAFFHLWKTEEEFRARVLSGKGFCLPHFRALMEQGRKYLSGEKYKEFVRPLAALVLDNFHRVREDVLWLIDKYDYRFREEPWKNAKDSVPRGILKLSAYDAEEEKAEP